MCHASEGLESDLAQHLRSSCCLDTCPHSKLVPCQANIKDSRNYFFLKIRLRNLGRKERLDHLATLQKSAETHEITLRLQRQMNCK